MARSGMSNLITRWRRMVDDAGTAVWSDDQAQGLLDDHRVTIYGDRLDSIAQDTGASVTYKVYHSRYGNMEELTSGSEVWRLFDAQGSTIGTAAYTVDYHGSEVWRLFDAQGSTIGTAAYTVDYQSGVVSFTADQMGSARYLDFRAYDLAGAAADAWRQRAGMQADGYDFTADGSSFKRSQWFDHCQRMAAIYDQQRVTTVTTLLRSDVNG